MKIGMRLTAMGFLIIPFAACDATAPVSAPEEAVPSLELSSTESWGHARRGRRVARPFKARAFTLLESLAPDPRCGAPPRFLNVQVGEGRGTHLGRFDIRFEFCVDATDLLDDGQLTEGESLPYDNGTGTIVAANGDELYLVIEGAVVPSAHPDYDFEFRDPFEFVGGTGRFAEAGGAGTTESYVEQATDRTDHRLMGRLVLKKR